MPSWSTALRVKGSIGGRGGMFIVVVTVRSFFDVGAFRMSEPVGSRWASKGDQGTVVLSKGLSAAVGYRLTID